MCSAVEQCTFNLDTTDIIVFFFYFSIFMWEIRVVKEWTSGTIFVIIFTDILCFAKKYLFIMACIRTDVARVFSFYFFRKLSSVVHKRVSYGSFEAGGLVQDIVSCTQIVRSPFAPVSQGWC